MRALLFSTLLGLLALLPQARAFADGRYAQAPLTALLEIERWVSEDQERFWIQGEDSVFYYDKDNTLGPQPFADGDWHALEGKLYFFYGAHPLPTGGREILRGGRVRLIELSGAPDLTRNLHGGLRPLQKNSVLVRQTPANPNVQAKNSPFSLGQWIDADQWHQDVATLSLWTRYSYAPGNSEARLWLEEKLHELPGFEVSEFPFPMPRGTGINVLGQITGRSRPDEVYIVGAHYDSISEQPTLLAPGAEDNASGVAGVLALARVFAEHPPEATIIFVGFSGEEQGLYGSEAWTEDWLKKGRETSIKAVLIMDMIGYSEDDELDLLLETSKLTTPLLTTIHAVHRDPDLVVSESFHYWGSDHEPFLDSNIPAILFIENDYLDYPSYHRSTDTIDKIHPDLGPMVLRLMADSLGEWVF